jgi:hypothetical protein
MGPLLQEKELWLGALLTCAETDAAQATKVTQTMKTAKRRCIIWFLLV